MKIRRSAHEIAGGLENLGLEFRSFTVASEGEWSPEDADWNYKDVPHLNVVHSQARTVLAAIGDEIAATVNMQRIAGIPVPIALANYVAADGTQVYFTTLLCFVLVVSTRIVDPPDPTTVWARVETTYFVGGPRVAMLMFPFIKRILSANYNVLMSEDIPMRVQRGRLRKLGYTFLSDGRPRTFAETTELWSPNVVAPAGLVAEPCSIALADLQPADASINLGDSPDGLRLVHGEGSTILVFERICSHEGADLGPAPMTKGCLVCPWHAKRVRPAATFDLEDLEEREIDVGEARRLTIREGLVTASVKI